MDDDDFHEAFLKANANEPYIADQFSEFIRNILRATASSGHSSQQYYAMERLSHCFELLRHADELNLRILVNEIVESLEVPDDQDDVEGAVVYAAKMGMRVLIEKSCVDNAARARASRRESEFLQANEDIHIARQLARKKYFG